MLGAKIFPSTDDFFQQSFSKTGFTRPGTFWDEAFFWNFFVFFSKVLVIYGETFFLCQKIQAGGPVCNLNVQRSIPRKNVFEKQAHKRQLGQKTQTIDQKSREGCHSSIQRHHKNDQWEEKNFTISFFFYIGFRARKVNFRVLVQNTGIMSKRVPRNNQRKVYSWTSNKKKLDNFQVLRRKVSSKLSNLQSKCPQELPQILFFCENLLFLELFP